MARAAAGRQPEKWEAALVWAGQEEAKLEGKREGGEGGAATSGYASE